MKIMKKSTNRLRLEETTMELSDEEVLEQIEASQEILSIIDQMVHVFHKKRDKAQKVYDTKGGNRNKRKSQELIIITNALLVYAHTVGNFLDVLHSKIYETDENETVVIQ